MRKIILVSFLFMTMLARQAWSQDRQVTGKVTAGEDGSSIPGVNVAVRGTTTGTTTDATGNYRLSVADGATLQFSAVGYTRQEIAVGSQTTINVTMVADVASL
ncbi:MAG: carboxypeptidase-like regulatory domain-containing protein [Cytophagaceae bacterium]|nr:carboxypeptidase-like regulatory domain-containing protein [Cytophagaceae bacterium]